MKPQNFIKRILTFFVLLAFVTAAHSQSATETMTVVQRVDTLFQFNIASYHCFSSSFLTVIVRKECDAYVADWRTHFGKLTLQKPGSGTVALTEGQISELREFAKHVSPAAVHSENCSGTTYFKLTGGGNRNEKRLCGCAPNVKDELLTIIGRSKQGSVQHQL